MSENGPADFLRIGYLGFSVMELDPTVCSRKIQGQTESLSEIDASEALYGIAKLRKMSL